jgi:hypothetical protein
LWFIEVSFPAEKFIQVGFFFEKFIQLGFLVEKFIQLEVPVRPAWAKRGMGQQFLPPAHLTWYIAGSRSD